MHSDVLLQDNSVGELLLANGARVLHQNRRVFSVDTNVCLQVAFGGESPATHLAFKGPLPGVNAVVHLQRTLAAEDAVTEDALVGVRYLFVDILHQLLKL